MFGLKKHLGYLHSVKWGGAAIGTSLLRQLLLVPVFIMSIGDTGYSTWLLLFSVASFVNAFSAGFLHYSCNLINISYHSRQDVKVLIYNIFKATLWIVVLQAVLGLLLSSTGLLSVFVNVDQVYLQQQHASIALLFLIAARLLYQYNTAFILRMFEPLGRIKDTLKFQFFTDFTDVLATAIIVLFTRSLVYTCVSVFVVNLAMFFISFVYARRQVAFFSFKKQSVNTPALIKNSLGLNAGFFIEKLYDSCLNLMVSQFFGPALVPVFNTSQKLVNIFYRVSYMVVQPLFPEIQRHFAVNDYQYLSGLIKKHWRISLVVIMVSISVAISLLPYFYRYWTGNALEFDMTLMLYLFVGILLQNFMFVIGEFFKKTNFSRQFMIYSLLKSSITVVFMAAFSFSNYMPGIGAAIAVAEFVCVLYLLKVFPQIAMVLFDAYWYLINVLLYCGLLFLYVVTQSYLLFILLVSLQLFLMLYFNRKNYRT